MIVCCPGCQARIRVDRQRLGGKRITLRCARCGEIFKAEVVAPQCENLPYQVLVAHHDPAMCGTIRDVLSGAGIGSRIEHDGNNAFRQMEVQPPQVAILDVAIPGLYIFELIEQMRQHPLLARTRIILLSSVYNKAAYKRTPSSLYGADDYIEKHHIPDRLVAKVHHLAAGTETAVGEASEGAASAQLPGNGSPDLVELNARIQRAENDDLALLGEKAEKARHLAQMIAADIALYHQEKMDEGIRGENVFGLLQLEVEEGRRIFRQRMPHDFKGDFVGQAFAALIERRQREILG